MLRSRLLWKLFAGYAALVLLTTATLGFLVSRPIARDSLRETEATLRAKAALLREIAGREAGLQDRVRALGTEIRTRLTVIRADGAVLADSEEDPSRMENHRDRPEVAAARERGVGTDTRHSHTLGVDMMYVSLPLEGGGFVRAALPLTAVDERLRHLRAFVILGGAAAIVVGLLFGFLLARSVTRPLAAITEAAESIAAGNYDREVRTDAAGEIGNLAETFNRMAGHLRERMQTIGRLEHVRRDFVANVSHELKTPLTAIKGFIETLIEDPSMDPGTHRRFLGRIRDQTARLTSLVADLLTLSRVESEQGALERQPLDLREPVQDSARSLAPAAEAKKVALESHLPDAPLAILGDREALRQVVDNLLDNAIKYTPPGGRVSVRLLRRDQEAVAEVEDTGCGIEAQHLDRIFERFYRVDKARSRELGGTGLGLSIVKHIVLAHGGRVSVESSPRGSTFRVHLPLAT